jgi:MOZ/SAS family/MYST family zinc finger domain
LEEFLIDSVTMNVLPYCNPGILFVPGFFSLVQWLCTRMSFLIFLFSRLDEWVTLDHFHLDTLKRFEPGGDDPTISNITRSSSSIAEQDSRQAARESLMIRRRSSASLGSHAEPTGSSIINDNNNDNNNVIEASSSFSLTGGNWHGTSGDPALADFEREHEETTKVKNIEKIIMGEWDVEAWYYSPFPEAYSDLATLYVCEFCLSYMKKKRTLNKHKAECSCRHPPGRQIYHEGDLSVYEIDGKDHRAYCQKLCLLAKLFLDHKTLYYDVNPFYFFIVTKVDDVGAHIVGYFSKEKVSVIENKEALLRLVDSGMFGDWKTYLASLPSFYRSPPKDTTWLVS